MTEHDVFERRLRAALLRHVADAPTGFDALEFAREVAAQEPRGRRLAARLSWPSLAVPGYAWVLLAAGLLFALVVGGMVAGAMGWRPNLAVMIAPQTPATTQTPAATLAPSVAPSPASIAAATPAQYACFSDVTTWPELTPNPSQSAHAGTLTVTITSLHGAAGSCLAAIVYNGVPTAGLGGVEMPVTVDPFTFTATLRAGSPLLPATSPPQLAMLPAGTHTLVLYLSTYLRPYSEWVPAVPVDRACTLDVTVVAGRTTEVRVIGDSLIQGDPAGYMPGAPVCQTLVTTPR
jgi:hypothetical protein